MSSDNKQNPYETTNLFSYAFFWWTRSLFRKSTNYEFYNVLPEDRMSELGDRLERKWNEVTACQPKDHEGLFFFTLMKEFWKDFLVSGVIYFVKDIIFKITVALLLKQLLIYFYLNADNSSEEPIVHFVSSPEAWLTATGFVFGLFADVLLANIVNLYSKHLGLKLNVAACALIERKCFKISYSSVQTARIGQLINLLVHDTVSLEKIPLHFHTLWSAPIFIIFTIIASYTEFGLGAIIGMLFMLLIITLNTYLCYLRANCTENVFKQSSKRIHLLKEVMWNIQLIKLYVWENPIKKMFLDLSKTESYWLHRSAKLNILILATELLPTVIVIYLILLANTFLGISTFENVFFIWQVVNVAFGIARKRPILILMEGWNSARRIQEYLFWEDRIAIDTGSISRYDSSRKSDAVTVEAMVSNTTVPLGTVVVQNCVASWHANDIRPIINGISFEAKNGNLLAITGPSGGGKSSLLQVLLGEMLITHGSITVQANSISYCPQKPWIFIGTWLENIVCGRPFDITRYKKVVKACKLDRDINTLSKGDRTVIGEESSLSGGQKVRIALARAAYTPGADLCLLDEPLASLDTSVGKYIYEKCIVNVMNGTTRILVTSQSSILRNVNHSLVMKSGTILFQGTYNELQNHYEFEQFVTSHNAEDTNIDLQTEQVTKPGSSRFETYTERLQYNWTDGNKNINLAESVYKYFLKGATKPLLIILFLLFLVAQLCTFLFDISVLNWISTREKNVEAVPRPFLHTSLSELITDDTTTNALICTVIVSVLILMFFLSSKLYFMIALRTSKNLQDAILEIVLNAPYVFYMANRGKLFSRFSGWFFENDRRYSTIFHTVAYLSFQYFGIFIVTILINPWFLAVLFLIVPLMWSVKRSMGISIANFKKPDWAYHDNILTSVKDITEGLPTIRVLGMERYLQKKLEASHDSHTSARFLLLTTLQSLSLRTQFIGIVYVTVITFTFMLSQTGISSIEAGLVLKNALILIGTLYQIMASLYELAENAPRLESLLSLLELNPMENDFVSNSHRTSKQKWPSAGRVQFNHVTLQYSNMKPLALNDISINIRPMQKVGIVGRTGSGKTTLVETLFRLVDFDGDILIDGTSVKEITLRQLRSSISILPQDPVFFTGTLRNNLDPFNEFADHELWNALDKVSLKQFVELKGGLYSSVTGDNWPICNVKLIAMSRLLLLQNKIVIFDELTEHLDPRSEALVLKLIHQNFTNCTVFAVSHRLHSIIAFDRVIVMSDGYIMEDGHPFELLQKTGMFTKLVCDTGPKMEKILREVAKKAYNK